LSALFGPDNASVALLKQEVRQGVKGRKWRVHRKKERGEDLRL
jgi:hypothetical protein